MVFSWRADDGPTLIGSFVIFQGIRTSIAKKPYIFVIFQGGSGPPVPPPLDPHLKLEDLLRFLLFDGYWLAYLYEAVCGLSLAQ